MVLGSAKRKITETPTPDERDRSGDGDWLDAVANQATATTRRTAMFIWRKKKKKKTTRPHQSQWMEPVAPATDTTFSYICFVWERHGRPAVTVASCRTSIYINQVNGLSLSLDRKLFFFFACVCWFLPIDEPISFHSFFFLVTKLEKALDGICLAIRIFWSLRRREHFLVPVLFFFFKFATDESIPMFRRWTSNWNVLTVTQNRNSSGPIAKKKTKQKRNPKYFSLF